MFMLFVNKQKYIYIFGLSLDIEHGLEDIIMYHKQIKANMNKVQFFIMIQCYIIYPRLVISTI